MHQTSRSPLPILLLLLAAASPAGAQARWNPSATGTAAEFRGLHAVGPDVVWAAGRGGVVAHTADAGASWRVDTIPGAERLFLVDVHALDDRAAWVAGTAFEGAALGAIFHTADGGRTWTRQYADSTPGIFLDGLAFLDPKRGVAFGDPIGGRFVILTTENGGATWTPSEGAPAALQGEAAFAASGTAIVAQPGGIWIGTGGGPRARVLHSADGGRTWTGFETPATGGASKGLFGLALGTGGTGIAVGGDYRRPAASAENLLLTADGGRTWRVGSSEGLAGIQYGAAHAGGDGFVSAGPPGSALSLDGGRTWTRIDGPGFNTVSCAGSLAACWAAGTDGRIARLVVPPPTPPRPPAP